MSAEQDKGIEEYTQNSESFSFSDPIEGIDYIVDHYTVIGIDRTATQEEINTAFRNQIRQNHPDVVARASQEIQQQAIHKTIVLNNAHEILSDPVRRQDYDQILTDWEGPISESGHPVITFDKIARDPRYLEYAIDTIDNILPEDNSIFNLLQSQFDAAEDPSEDITDAYRQVLKKRDERLEALEAAYEAAAGLRETEGDRNFHHATNQRDRIEQQRARLEEELQDRREKITSGSLPALPAGENLQESDIENALVTYEAQQREQFEEIANTLERIAQDRQEIINKKMNLLQIEYVDTLPELSEKIIIGLQGDQNTLWFPFKLQSDNIGSDPDISFFELLGQNQDQIISDYMSKGYNIILTKADLDIDEGAQMSEVAMRHFEAYYSQRGIDFERGDQLVVASEDN